MTDKKKEYITGYIVRFGNPEDRDLDGEYFSPDTKVNFPTGGLVENGSYLAGEYSHGISDDLQPISIKRIEVDEVGISLTTELQYNIGSVMIGKAFSEDDLQQLRNLIDKKVVSFAPAGSFEVDEDGFITKADIQSIILTSTPTDPKSIPIKVVKNDKEK